MSTAKMEGRGRLCPRYGCRNRQSPFATSPGTRNAAGVWTPEEARKLLAFTKSMGGAIAAAEFMNETHVCGKLGGAPKGYDAAAYGRDTAVFHQFIKQTAPEKCLFLGPARSAKEDRWRFRTPEGLKSEDLLKVKVTFSYFFYHLYAAVSKRCASMGESSANLWLKLRFLTMACTDRNDPRILCEPA